MAPELERSDPPYVQIARRIREDIESGALPEGATVPSAREIMATWGVALATATKVHARLRSEGLIEAVPGVGTIVAARQSIADGLQRLASTHARGLIYGGSDRAVIRSSELLPAPSEVAAALALEEGTLVVRRERVIFRDTQPLTLSTNWLPGEHIDQAPELLTTNRIRQGTFAYLAVQTGHTVSSGREQVSAGTATPGQASALNIEAGDPVLLTRTWYFIEDGTPIEYGEGVHPAGGWLSHDFALTS
jgi:DNA-binding GntR family transcriptional regulator